MALDWSFLPLLVSWYDESRRAFPWRAQVDQKPNPYHVWISEIMLQQTGTKTVISYFERFIQKWPTLEALTSASLEEILTAWQGLGYYRRAHFIDQTARILKAQGWPPSEEGWLALPGIGPYTASAIVSIAWNRSSLALDGNTIRVLTRVHGLSMPLEEVRNKLKQSWPFIQERPGDVTQALIDLGATVCLPKKPKCSLCPLQQICMGYASGNPEGLPMKTEKKRAQKKYGLALIERRSDGAIAFYRREANQLLPGTYFCWTSPWENESTVSLPESHWRPCGKIQHLFTHIHLELTVFWTEYSLGKNHATWMHPTEWHRIPLSTLMQKILTCFEAKRKENHP